MPTVERPVATCPENLHYFKSRYGCMVSYQSTSRRHKPEDLDFKASKALHIFVWTPVSESTHLLTGIARFNFFADPGEPWVHHEALQTSALVLELPALASR